MYGMIMLYDQKKHLECRSSNNINQIPLVSRYPSYGLVLSKIAVIKSAAQSSRWPARYIFFSKVSTERKSSSNKIVYFD
jgi:hypothetical protein